MEAYTLLVEGGPDAGRRFPLQIGATLIGRESENGLILTDLKVSRQHVRIELSANGDLGVRDLDSFNGTRLNGQVFAGSRPLKVGDTIELGDTLLRVAGGRP